METIFKNKKMVILHPSGVVSEYTAENLQVQIDRTRRRISELNAEISHWDSQIASINTSAVN